jgi:membrane-bound ClpP family serine protease
MNELTIALALILLGLVLMVAEIFIPSFGILFALALVALIVGVTLAFSSSSETGVGTLIAVCIALPVLWSLAMYFWPKTPLGQRFVLNAPPEDETLASTPMNKELEQLRGQYGRTISALRPAGITDFNGRRVDTISEGGMIEPGHWVRCIDVKSGRVIVREVDGPPNLENFDTTELR